MACIWKKLTKAQTLIKDSGYDPAFKDETLQNTLIFALRSHKVRKDAIAKENSLLHQGADASNQTGRSEH